MQCLSHAASSAEGSSACAEAMSPLLRRSSVVTLAHHTGGYRPRHPDTTLPFPSFSCQQPPHTHYFTVFYCKHCIGLLPKKKLVLPVKGVMPKKGRQRSQPSVSCEEEDIASHYSSPTRHPSTTCLPSLTTETTQVPQNMNLCSILKWITDRDNATRVEREKEAARQREKGSNSVKKPLHASRRCFQGWRTSLSSHLPRRHRALAPRQALRDQVWPQLHQPLCPYPKQLSIRPLSSLLTLPSRTSESSDDGERTTR